MIDMIIKNPFLDFEYISGDDGKPPPMTKESFIYQLIQGKRATETQIKFFQLFEYFDNFGGSFLSIHVII